MGGSGSGRWRWHSKKDTVEDCRCIDIPWLLRHDYFCGWKWSGIEWKNAFGQVTSSIGITVSVKSEDPGENYIRLVYSKGPNGEIKVDYKVQLDTTPCNFGGVRYWFICPLSRNGCSCGRRVSKLYLPPGGRYFGCRHCYDLTYESCQTHDKRIDALIRNPDILQARMNSEDLGGSILALKAYTKLLGKF